MRNNRTINSKQNRLLEKDKQTLMAMARIYCHGHCHIRGSEEHADLCPECHSIIEYALERTRKCPHEHKGTCDTCTIQCYKPAMRAEIRKIMAYSGPRMMLHHPLMALQHLAKKHRNGRGRG